MAQTAERSGRLNILVSVVCNAILVGIKLALGVLGRSQALIADAIHSMTDFATDILAFFGLKYAFKDRDEDHPFGHGKIDTLMSLLIGIAMLLAGMWLAYESIMKIVTGESLQPNFWALAGALSSIVIKEGLYQYTYRVGKEIGNNSLIANAWHHRTDAISSVAVLVGVIPGLINPSWAVFDAFAAILVAGMIFKVGIDVVIPAFRDVSDAAPSDEEIEKIRRVVYTVDGVRNAHDIRARYYSNKLYVEVHVMVDPEITVREGHEIAAKVRRKLKHELSNILDAIVHLDPDDQSHAHHHEQEPAPKQS